MFERIGPDRFFQTVDEAVNALRPGTGPNPNPNPSPSPGTGPST